MEILSRIEEILLLAIWKLQDNAYGITIREQVQRDTGQRLLPGAIYAPLSRLKKNRYVLTRSSNLSTDRGGRPRIYYQLSPLGQKKLAESQEIVQAIWTDVPDLRKELN